MNLPRIEKLASMGDREAQHLLERYVERRGLKTPRRTEHQNSYCIQGGSQGYEGGGFGGGFTGVGRGDGVGVGVAGSHGYGDGEGSGNGGGNSYSSGDGSRVQRYGRRLI